MLLQKQELVFANFLKTFLTMMEDQKLQQGREHEEKMKVMEEGVDVQKDMVGKMHEELTKIREELQAIRYSLVESDGSVVSLQIKQLSKLSSMEIRLDKLGSMTRPA